MKRILPCVLSVCFFLISAGGLAAQSPANPESKGEALERQIWADMKSRNWTSLRAKIAPGFQSVHPDGPRDKAGELALIKGLHLGKYKLKDFDVTQSGDSLIVTYWISVQETIDGERLSTKPAQRMSVWKKTAAGWQWIAHANLNPL
jgi:uncharacterized protein DUF4440